MADKFKNYADTLESPFTHAEAVTPSDDDDLANVSRGIFVGEAGPIKGTMEGGATITPPDTHCRSGASNPRITSTRHRHHRLWCARILVSHALR